MVEIAPSILSADFSDLRGALAAVERGGARIVHLDVMDGHFVPNLTIGPPVVASLRPVTQLPLDTHLMISEPLRYVPAFLKAGANMISVHYEADAHLNRTIGRIKEGGALAGVAINPATPVHVLDEIILDVDYVLLMTVNPGFGGQAFIESSYNKVRRLRALIQDRNPGVRIEVDGGIGPSNVARIVEAGAEIIVAGSAIFGQKNPQEAVETLNRISWKLTAT